MLLLRNVTFYASCFLLVGIAPDSVLGNCRYSSNQGIRISPKPEMDAPHTQNEGGGYFVVYESDGGIFQHKIFLDEGFQCHHFMTVLDDAQIYALRFHPGDDENGWGTTIYLCPFLDSEPGPADVIVDVQYDAVRIQSSGLVRQLDGSANGTWSCDIVYSYLPQQKIISGNGTYSVRLEMSPYEKGENVNVYRIASNYLDDVNLLDGTIGDTGDMEEVSVDLGYTSFIWDIEGLPSHFPWDFTDDLDVFVKGRYNIVDAIEMGADGFVKAAYKPSLQVRLIDQSGKKQMTFGAMWDSEANSFEFDNVGITPLFPYTITTRDYDFDLSIMAEALADDSYNADVDRDGCVDLPDFTAVAEHYGLPAAPLLPENVNQQDFVVDFADLTCLAEYWLRH
jgi:hypothetical protein